MKRYIHNRQIVASDVLVGSLKDMSAKSIISYLNENGIDTTKQRYELVAEDSDRYQAGDTYTIEFQCYGDWLAYFSMRFHKNPILASLKEYYDTEDFMELVDDYPDVESMKSNASSRWYGDGGDFIVYLKNLTTGEYLYRSERD